MPRDGWPPSDRPAPVDLLTQTELDEINDLLPWQCFTVDRHGRRLGSAAWSGKRDQPQAVPDPRILRLDEHLGLAGRAVLEVGCFEGVHTTALCDRAASVTAVDARTEHVAKTAVRCALLGVRPSLRTCDVEREPADSVLWQHDVIHHVGVLYHLRDPVRHLRAAAAACRVGLMLDTHFAEPDETDEDWEVDGETFAVKRFVEAGRSGAFAGMYDHARWLTHADLRRCLEEAGLQVRVDEARRERNGSRVLLIAARPGGR